MWIIRHYIILDDRSILTLTEVYVCEVCVCVWGGGMVWQHQHSKHIERDYVHGYRRENQLLRKWINLASARCDGKCM